VPLVLQRSGQFAAVCDRCMAGRRSNLGSVRAEARAEAIALGWQERLKHIRLQELAAWFCPACVKETSR
jgi:hypothetical protein